MNIHQAYAKQERAVCVLTSKKYAKSFASAKALCSKEVTVGENCVHFIVVCDAEVL